MDEIKRLAEKYPIPTQTKFERNAHTLVDLAEAYEEQKVELSFEEARLLNNYINAINYFVTISKMYRKLTRELKTKAEEAYDETRADSKSR